MTHTRERGVAVRVHPFRRIADDLREEILDGRLAPGARLPSENDLAAQYTTTRATVRKAIALLRGEGYIAGAQGSGSYVRSRPALLMVCSGSSTRRETGSPLRPATTTDPPGETCQAQPAMDCHARGGL